MNEKNGKVKHADRKVAIIGPNDCTAGNRQLYETKTPESRKEQTMEKNRPCKNAGTRAVPYKFCL